MTVAPESIRASRLHLSQGIDVCTIEWSTYSPNKPSPKWGDLFYHNVESIRFSRKREPLVFRCTLYDRAAAMQEPMRVEVTVEYTDWAAWLLVPTGEPPAPARRTKLEVPEDPLLLGCRSHKVRSMPDESGCHRTQVVTHHECTLEPGCDCNGYQHTGDIHCHGLTESYQPAFS